MTEPFGSISRHASNRSVPARPARGRDAPRGIRAGPPGMCPLEGNMETVREQPAPGTAEANNVVKIDRQRGEAPAPNDAPVAKKSEAAPAPAVAASQAPA